MAANRKRSGIFWFFLVSAFFLAFFAGSLYLVVRSFRGAVSPVVRGSAMVIDLAVAFPEESLFDLGGPIFGYETLTFRDLLGGISRAKEDARIEKLLLHVRSTGFGWGHAEVSLQTKKIKGLHENDFIMAAKINRLVDQATG